MSTREKAEVFAIPLFAAVPEPAPVLPYHRFTMKAVAAVLLAAAFTAHAAEKPRSPQSAAESVDLDVLARIRDEGFNHSHIMEYASGLFDGIGARLTGSPEFERAAHWSIVQLRNMGAANPHTESWGDFGMGWQQIGASVQLVTPSSAVFIAQATPWSPATPGEVTGSVIAVPRIDDEAALAKWKGKLSGKIVLYGNPPKISPDPTNPLQHYDAAKLDHFATFPLDGDQSDSYVLSSDQAQWEKAGASLAFREKVGHFFADEHASAVLVPGGANGMILDDTNGSFGWFVFQPGHKQTIASAVIASEAFGRMSRLLDHKVPVTVRLKIDTRFTGDHVDGENVIADFPGSDPALKDQVVMLGGHLDSWIAGTGATDNGAGTIIALEAMRILRALDLHPRRTVRIGLWGGEEQGIYGSAGYVNTHLATITLSSTPAELLIPSFLRQQTANPIPKPDHARLDAYFNADNGTGRFLGIYTEGNAAVEPIFRQWAASIRDLDFTTVSPRNTGSTDHVSFDAAGLPGFQFIQDPRDYETRSHHSNLDTYERLSEPDLKQAAVIMAMFVYNTAQRDAMLPRKPPPQPVTDHQRDQPLKDIYPTSPTP